MAKRLFVLAALIALAAVPAAADEAKTPVSAAMFFSIMRAPVETRDVAFDRSLKDEGPAPRAPVAEILPDGSVKIDRAVITVRNPCPPGHDKPPLPGRRARN
jgi:hypothetical protein